MGSTEDLRKELDQLKADVAKLRDSGNEALHDLRASAEDEMRRRRQILRRGIEAGQVRGRRAVDEMEEEIGTHPYASMLAAVGVGFILAKLLDITTRR